MHESARLALEAAAREQWREVLAAIDAMESASLEVSRHLGSLAAGL